MPGGGERKLARIGSALVERAVRPWRVRNAVRHLAGPESVEYGPDEVLAISVVRNGAAHLPAFLEHHFALGVCHVVLLDNGSTDATVDIAREHERVTLLRCDLPYAQHENVMKRYLARRFSLGRWNLCVDVDELFDYPYSSSLGLRSLIGYLNHRSFTAVVAQMLDLFPAGPLREARIVPGASLRETFPFYDLTDVRRTPYPFGTLSNPAVHMHWGGIRKAVFGTDNGLTKAPLVRVEESVDLFVKYHHVRNARVADFTCALLHFPFTEAFAAKVEEAVTAGRYGGPTAWEYERYREALLAGGGDLRLMRPTARRLGRVEELTAEGFLVVSGDYLRWVEERRGAAAS